MSRLKIVKILFIFGAMLFVTKPFLGFVIFNQHCQPMANSILVKIFSKRSPEFSEDNSFNLSAGIKKPANPGLDKYPSFPSFVNVIFFGLIAKDVKISVDLPQDIRPHRCEEIWLLFKKLVI